MHLSFSVNSIAIANLRSRRRQYRLLISGIVLAIYFVATTLLFAATMFTSLKEQHYQLVGKQDAIIFNCQDAPLEELLESGVLSEYGTAEIVGYVLPDGQNKASGFSIARFDETALTLAGKEALEGRLPNKAGEIALERSTLARLRTNAGVGDTITLTLLIPDGTGFMDSPVQKTFTIVGIVPDKLGYLNQWDLGTPAYHDFPAGVLSVDEPIAAGGKEIVNCYGRYAQGAHTSFELLKSFCEKNGIINDYGWADVEITHYQLFGSNNNTTDYNIIFTSVFFMIITLILMCTACLGIVNSFTASLESRKRQIGLLRAVGATKKQIRQIFGRETLLLAAFSIPLGLLLACLTAWGITGILGPDYIFHLNALIIALVAAAGVLCVLLAASIPLRKAAKIPPMQAIRDIDLSRRMKKSTVKSKRVFNVSRHIARRNLTLYKNKQVMITAMLVVSIMLLSLVVFAATPLIREAEVDYGSDYQLFQAGGIKGWFVEYEFHKPGITEQDRADVATLPTVKTVIGEKVLTVKILTNKITPYMAGNSFNDIGNLSLEIIEETAPELLAAIPEPLWPIHWWHDSFYEQSKTKYGYTQDYLTVNCCGIDAEVVEKLSPFVSAGSIDTDKLSSGEEILIIAPAEYGISIHRESNESISGRTDYVLDENKTYTSVYQNDTFHAGDVLTMSLLYSDEPEQYDEDGNPKLPDEAVRIDKSVAIGAILEINAGEKDLREYFSSSFHPGDIITTTTGLDALGFDRPYDTLSITLTESPDPAMEEYLDTNLSQIAARTAGVDLLSFIAIARENRKITYGLLIAAGALIILFFAICASMVNNTLSARIWASKREIGTIRAVGASEREIVHSYLWQLVSMFSWGTIIGLVAELAVCRWLLAAKQIPAVNTALPVWQPLLFVVLLFLICCLNIRSKVGVIFRGSIVENIREL
ncbi:MAG: FtsX-like permease family protein [Syntrophaceticus schinkii]|jgi:ABC-type lipoprotein release transport system permease subunit